MLHGATITTLQEFACHARILTAAIHVITSILPRRIWALVLGSNSGLLTQTRLASTAAMGRKAPPFSQKYGAPLYAVAWPTQELLFVAGGGGKKSSGIKNRCTCLPSSNASCNPALPRVNHAYDRTPWQLSGHRHSRFAGWSYSVVALRCQGGQLSEEVAALELDDCPIRMVALPDGKDPAPGTRRRRHRAGGRVRR